MRRKAAKYLSKAEQLYRDHISGLTVDHLDHMVGNGHPFILLSHFEKADDISLPDVVRIFCGRRWSCGAC